MQLRVLLLAVSLALNGAGVAGFAIRPELAPLAVHEFLARRFGGETEAPAAAPKRAAKPVARKALWLTIDPAGDYFVASWHGLHNASSRAFA